MNFYSTLKETQEKQGFEETYQMDPKADEDQTEPRKTDDQLWAQEEKKKGSANYEKVGYKITFM